MNSRHKLNLATMTTSVAACLLAMFASPAFAQVKILGSSGKVAKGATVFSLSQASEGNRNLIPVRIANFPKEGSKLSLTLHEPKTNPPMPTSDPVSQLRTNEKGIAGVPVNTFAALAVSSDGTEVAFSPPGSITLVENQTVKMRPCGKLKFDISKVSNLDQKCTVVIVWKNCLAGAYPLYYPKLEKSAPLDWRLYPYFEIVTALENRSLAELAELELYLPPGEVSVAAVSIRQLENINEVHPNFRQTFHSYLKLNMPANCGIHKIKSSESTEVALSYGSCLIGKIASNNKNAMPDWGGSEFKNASLWFRPYTAKSSLDRLPFPAFTTEDYLKNPEKVVNGLTRDDVLEWRIRNQVSVTTALIREDGSFVTMPFPKGNYRGEIVVQRQRRRPVESSPGGETLYESAVDPPSVYALEQFDADPNSEDAAIIKLTKDIGIMDLGKFRYVEKKPRPVDQSTKKPSEPIPLDSSRPIESPMLSNAGNPIAKPAVDDIVGSISTIDDLKSRIEKEFDAKQQERERELLLLEDLIIKAREKWKTRENNRNEIIRRRIKELLKKDNRNPLPDPESHLR